ncbi:MAG: hypothetical protein O3B44_06750, partial [Bacteroidetes bacterium]|nr:hypothetical protein [Bacteroidota bacterium]
MKKPNQIIEANGGEEPEDEYSDKPIYISQDRRSMVLCPLEGEESDGWEDFIELKSSIEDF